MKLSLLFEDRQLYTLFIGCEEKSGPFIPGYASDNVNQASIYACWAIDSGKKAKIYKIEIELPFASKIGFDMYETDWDKISKLVPPPGVMTSEGEAIVTIPVPPIELGPEEFTKRLPDSGIGGYHNRDTIHNHEDSFIRNIGKIYPGHKDQIIDVAANLGIIDI